MILVCQSEKRDEIAKNIIRQTMWSQQSFASPSPAGRSPPSAGQRRLSRPPDAPASPRRAGPRSRAAWFSRLNGRTRAGSRCPQALDGHGFYVCVKFLLAGDLHILLNVRVALEDVEIDFAEKALG